jgi:hypothetical protein
MKNFALFGLVLTLCASPISAPAQNSTDATTVVFSIHNRSDRCALVTLYTARGTQPWKKFDAGFANVGITRQYHLQFPNASGKPMPVKIKVRAEFKVNGCAGPGGNPDVSNENTALPAGPQLVYHASCSLEGKAAERYYVSKPTEN